MLWLIYFFAIIIAFVGYWLLLRKLWNTLAITVTFWLLALPFLVPFAVESESYSGLWMAPALIVAAFEAIAGNHNLVSNALRPVFLVECAALFAVLLIFIVRVRRRKKAK